MTESDWGVQIIIAAWLKETFGKRLDRTAATLAAVALDQQTSETSSRTAFSSRKRVVKSADFNSLKPGLLSQGKRNASKQPLRRMDDQRGAWPLYIPKA